MKVEVIVVVINHCGPGNDVVCPGNDVVHGPGNNVGMGADDTGCLMGNHHIVVHSTLCCATRAKAARMLSSRTWVPASSSWTKTVTTRLDLAELDLQALA